MDAEKQMTAEEFLAFAEQHPDKRFDFIDGEMVEVSPKPLHGRIHSIFVAAFIAYNQQNPVGVVYTETLHVLNGENLYPKSASIRKPMPTTSPHPRWLPSKFARIPNPELHSTA